jgi:hypothetical protein
MWRYAFGGLRFVCDGGFFLVKAKIITLKISGFSPPGFGMGIGQITSALLRGHLIHDGNLKAIDTPCFSVVS